MSVRHLDRLLEPRSVAVIGASNRAGTVGSTVWRNLRSGRFAGPVYAVNPQHRLIDGDAAFARVGDLPQPPDLAVLCTPPATLPGLIAELGAAGTRAAVIMTAGLTAAQKQAVLDAARPHLLRVLGPNCLGLLTPRLGLNASFSHTDALDGELAFISQSGALVTAVLDWAKSRHIGFSHLLSIGEHADVDFGDLLDHLASDSRTRSILLYIESIDATPKFMSAARAAARNKPVIVVKAGRAGNGVKAAASHTGAMAGSDIVMDAAIRRAGMLRVDTLQELFMAAETLTRMGSNQDDLLTIMTNGGGAGVMAADYAAMAGLPLAELSEPLREHLDTLLPGTWSGANPVDMIGDAPVDRYTGTLQALLETPDTGAVLFLHAPTAIVHSQDIARACAAIARQHPGRVMAAWLGGETMNEARRVFEEAGVADYATPEEAVRAFGMLRTYRHNQAMLLETPTASETAPPDTARAQAVIARALAEGRDMLNEHEAKALLEAYGIPVVRTVAVPADPALAVQAADDIGYPVALKIVSQQISHKSDAGGVKLNLADADAVRDAASTMLSRIAVARPDATLEGFTVQTMAVRPLAQELILGTSVDPVFGPVLLFGQGGTAVEVVADRVIGLPPLNRVLARDLISRTRVSRLLAGFRDHPPARMDAITDALVALSRMLADLPELAELDINPLWADHQGVLALDARVRVSAAAPGGAAHFAIAPYPAELAETVQWNGESLLLRPIRPEDYPQHRAFIDALDTQDLRLRFFSTQRELPRSELARLTQIDYAREMAFIAVRTVSGESPQTIGVVRAVADPDNVDAEFAILVRSDLKGRGLGQMLMRKMIDYLRARGTQRIVAEIQRENTAMQELARTNGFTVDAQRSDAASERFVLELRAPSSTR
ncbi:bifunctional acetate--CoA ligase family protein/GNAT family N-acetyltransferase [Rhizobacter sp. LjRoot28]|uniref:bifunctional acetate--CoA ligase family protein/GNAT family N-acetyltransferase n=1 Tax=Rhizobacter sp. LjRoot28 TaxID=3342309 RepID=UPI003ECEB232